MSSRCASREFSCSPRFPDYHLSRVANLVSGDVYFGAIPPEHWYQPDWIDERRAKAGRDALVANQVIYGGACSSSIGGASDQTRVLCVLGSVSYRNMCRFNSGFFYHHELLQQFKWYWRVEYVFLSIPIWLSHKSAHGQFALFIG